MNNFDILKLENQEYEYLIVMKTYDAPLNYLNEITNVLLTKKIKGDIIIDQIMHSGNSDDRFITAYFDGKSFDRGSFCFVNLSRKDNIRKHSSGILCKEPELIDYSILNKAQKKLISNGVYI